MISLANLWLKTGKNHMQTCIITFGSIAVDMYLDYRRKPSFAIKKLGFKNSKF